MDLVERLLEDDRRVGGHWRVEVGGTLQVVRALRWERGDEASWMDRLFGVQILNVSGLESWREFHPLDVDARKDLRLAPGQWVLAMRPYVEGQSLSEWMSGGRGLKLTWLGKMSSTLRGLHAQGAFHGALHPQNVIIDGEGNVRLVDPAETGLGLTSVESWESRQGVEFLAPEVRERKGGGEKADIFALAALCCWMAKGVASRDSLESESEPMSYGQQDVPESLPAPLFEVVRRALGKHADLRPSAQQFEDALRRCGVVVKPSFVALPPSLYRSLERDMLESLQEEGPVLLLEGREQTGRSFALERLFQRLQLAGRRVVLCRGDEVYGPGEGAVTRAEVDGDPWSPLHTLMTALTGEEFVGDAGFAGDYRHVLQRWTAELRDALSGRETYILWDDLDGTRPDVRAVWAHFLRRHLEIEDASATDFYFVATTSPDDGWETKAQRMTVVGPSKRSWDGWRSRTKWAEVRQLPDENWRQIASRWASRPVALFGAVNKALRVEEVPSWAKKKPRRVGMPEVSVIFAGDWRRHLRDLLQRGAYVEALESCEKLAQVLQRSGRKEQLAILGIWREVLGVAGRTPGRVKALEMALQSVEEEEMSGPAALIRAQLYGECGRGEEALELLQNLEGLHGERQVEAQLWRADLHLRRGEVEEAKAAVFRGMEAAKGETEEGPAYVRRLEVLACGIRGCEGDLDALDSLRRRAANFGTTAKDIEWKARCHVLCARGWELQGRWEAAIDAYLRAIEGLREAGFSSGLPKLYLEAGILYRRLGRLGLAREYCAQGRRMVDEATWPSTRGRLVAEEAKLALTVGRVDEATELVATVGREVEGKGADSMRAAYLEAAAELARRRGDFEEAMELCEAVMAMDTALPRQRAQACLKASEVALDASDTERARSWLEQARSHIEDKELKDLEYHGNLLQSRLWWEEGDLLERMTGTDRFRRYLVEAAEAGEHMLVLEQVGHLWERIAGTDQPALQEELAHHFHVARQLVCRGLGAEDRRRLKERLVDIPAPQSEADKAAESDGSVGLVDELRRDIAGLTEVKEALEKRLAERDRAVAVLQRRLSELEEELEQLRSVDSSGRGRPPKATRDEVLKALTVCDGDFDAAAESLGVSKRTLYRYVNRYDIEIAEVKS